MTIQSPGHRDQLDRGPRGFQGHTWVTQLALGGEVTPAGLGRDHQAPASVCPWSSKHSTGVGGLLPWGQGRGCGSVFSAWTHWPLPAGPPFWNHPGSADQDQDQDSGWEAGALSSGPRGRRGHLLSMGPPAPLLGRTPRGRACPSKSPCPRGGYCLSCALGPTAPCLWLDPLFEAAGPQAQLYFG